MPELTLTVQNLCAGYRPGLPIIHDLGLHVAAGEVVAVIGPNGAGKSTLVKAVAGLVHIESGRIGYGDVSLNGVAVHQLARHGVSYVPQTANIFQTLSVGQNLMLSAQRLNQDRHTKQQAVDSMFALFTPLGQKSKTLAGRLSGGQRQMLAIAMALVAQPTLMLMDEPTAGLAPSAAEDVLGLIRDVASRGVSVLLVEQNARAGLCASDRGYVLAEGRNQFDGPASALLDDPVVGEIYLGSHRRPVA